LSEAKAFLAAYYQKDFARQGVEIWTACGPAEHCLQGYSEHREMELMV